MFFCKRKLSYILNKLYIKTSKDKKSTIFQKFIYK